MLKQFTCRRSLMRIHTKCFEYKIESDLPLVIMTLIVKPVSDHFVNVLLCQIHNTIVHAMRVLCTIDGTFINPRCKQSRSHSECNHAHRPDIWGVCREAFARLLVLSSNEVAGQFWRNILRSTDPRPRAHRNLLLGALIYRKQQYVI